MEDQYAPNQTIENATAVQANTVAALQSAQGQQLQYEVEEQEKSLAESQLDCQETLNKVYHLLRQDVLRPDEKTKLLDWHPIEDETKRVLTDVGVDKLMQVMAMYINKETLLSNFNDKQINSRMLKFCRALNANIFLKYEVYFRVPTIDECKTILKARIEEKKKIKRLAHEIAGTTADETQIMKEIMDDVELRIEYEMQKIKEEKIKINLREYELIFTQLTALVDATHNRAWKGEERGSLRRHFNISEVTGTNNQQQKKGGFMGWGKN